MSMVKAPERLKLKDLDCIFRDLAKLPTKGLPRDPCQGFALVNNYCQVDPLIYSVLYHKSKV